MMRIILGIIIIVVLVVIIGKQVYEIKERARIRAMSVDCLVKHTSYDRSALKKMTTDEIEKLLEKVVDEMQLKIRKHLEDAQSNGEHSEVFYFDDVSVKKTIFGPDRFLEPLHWGWWEGKDDSEKDKKDRRLPCVL